MTVTQWGFLFDGPSQPSEKASDEPPNRFTMRAGPAWLTECACPCDVAVDDKFNGSNWAARHSAKDHARDKHEMRGVEPLKSNPFGAQEVRHK